MPRTDQHAGAAPSAADPALPAGFRLGAATAAYQIEGAADERGPSIWDEFTYQPGRIVDGSTGDIANDHVHRLDADLDLLAELGLQDYRFSIAWPRVVPAGRGAVDEAGLAFYERLVDGLLARGIRPIATLYHWDLPLALQREGGWLARGTAEAFAEYVRVVADRLGDRVRDWITLNEANVHILYGHALTDHAPALGLGFGALPAAHTILLAHGLAVRELRAAGAGRVGITSQHFPVAAASDAPEDLEAAAVFDAVANWAFSDPVLLGRYPSDEITAMVGLEPEQLAADLAVIAAPLDFYGVNYYEPVRIGAPTPERLGAGVLEVDIPDGMPFAPVPYGAAETTDFGWSIAPAAFTEILVALRDRYPGLPPIVVTEFGASFHDAAPDAHGRVRDDRRIDFLRRHLEAIVDAIDAGVDIRGALAWTAFDNFEWAYGYREPFGLIRVDRGTLERTVKDSGRWLRGLIDRRAARAGVS